MDMNTVQLVGRFTGDPEVKNLPNDNAVCTFQLAVNRVWFDSQKQKQEESTFVPVEVWGRTAKVVEKYCRKGSEVGIIGRLKLDNWDDKETGQKRSKLLVSCESLTLGSRCGENGGDNNSEVESNKPRGRFAGRNTKREEGSNQPAGEESVATPPNRRLF